MADTQTDVVTVDLVAITNALQGHVTTALAGKLDDTVKGLLQPLVAEQIQQALKAIEQQPTSPTEGFVIATEDGNGQDTKSFADFLIAIRDADRGYGKARKRLEEHYNAAKALNEQDGTEGGYTVPDDFNAQLLQVSAQFNPIDQLGSFGPMRVNMQTRSMSFPVLDQTQAPTAGNSALSAGVVARWTAESGAIPETEPKFRTMNLNAHKLSGYTAASAELEADTVIALQSLLVRLFGQAIGNNRFYTFLRGTGVGQPLGVLNSPAAQSVTRGTGAANYETADLTAMFKFMMPGGRYVWIHHPYTPSGLVDLTFGSQTAFAWGDIINGIPNRLLGMPTYSAEFMSAPGTAFDLGLFDWSYYMVGERAQTMISMSEHVRFLNDEKTWKFTHRVDGQPWISNKITLSDGTGTNVVSPFIYLN